MDRYWVYVRTSVAPVDMAHLSFTPEEWQAFIEGVKNGEFDL
jgi:hypothetical protein